VKVKAKSFGFFNNHKVKPGAVFECSEKEFSKHWMESLEGKKEEPAKVEASPKGKHGKSSGDAEVI
jgi:hypothetical protein